MPWKETNVMEQKEEFIREMMEGEMPFSHLCKKYGISEKTGYKWKKRYSEEGKAGLYEQSRDAFAHPNELSEDAVLDIVKLKSAHPYWGGKKIQELYRRAYPNRTCPSLSSVNRILKKAGLIRKRKTRPASADSRRLHQHILPEAVNDVWAIDFKGWWKSSGEICEPFTVRDLVSRKILCAKLLTSKDSDSVRAVMTGLFKQYGLPKVIRSDNGAPFCASNSVLTLTGLSAWWITLGIMPDRTEKGSPGQNGSLERMHADIAREIEGRIPGGRAANQAVLDAWVQDYNAIRPNEAIGMKTPDEVYTPSPRKYTGDYNDLEYPIGFLPRKVLNNGHICLDGMRVYVSCSLRGLTVGLKPMDERSYEVYLADFLLGMLDAGLCCFSPLDVVE